MDKCCICKIKIEAEDPAMLCVDYDGNPCYVCDKCEGHLVAIADNDDKEAVKGALDYLRDEFSKDEHATLVVDAVNELIEDSLSAKEETEEDKSEEEDEDE